MHLLKFASPLLLGLIALGCGSKRETSNLDITPRHTMTLALSESFRSDFMQFETAEVDLRVNAMGYIEWELITGLEFVKQFSLTQMTFQGQYQASYKDVSFATYQALPVTGQHTIGKIVSFQKMLDMGDGRILMSFEHFATGLKGQLQIQSGRNGLVEIKTITMNATRPVTMKIAQGDQEDWFQNADGIWVFGLKKMIALINGGMITLNNVD